jgi:hypothetical protein
MYRFVFSEDDYRYIQNDLILSYKFELISFYLFWNFIMKQGVALLLPYASPEAFGCLWLEVNNNILLGISAFLARFYMMFD